MGLERLQAQTRGSLLEREVAARFSLPTDELYVLNENDRLEPLVAADARITDELAKHEPGINVSGIGLLLPPADGAGGQYPGRSVGPAYRPARPPRRFARLQSARASVPTRSVRFFNACRGCSTPRRASPTTG